jgi:hypothetical protein
LNTATAIGISPSGATVKASDSAFVRFKHSKPRFTG